MDFDLLSPYAVHAQLTAQAQAIGGGQPGDGQRGTVATLTILKTVIPCTISPVVFDFQVVQGGKSPATMVEQCEFLVSDGPSNPASPPNVLLLTKGELCTLTVSNSVENTSKTIASYKMRLWHGGLLPGALLWRFMLVDANYTI